MGNLRVSNEVILAKIEGTYNTDSVPVAATNAVLVQSLTAAPEGLRMVARPVIRANLNDLQSVFGGQLMKLTFDVEVKGSGTAGTPPELGVLLRGAGCLETIVAVTSVTYTPRSNTHDSLTIYWYEGGRKLHKLTGARGDWSLSLTAGGVALYKFSFTGHYTEPTDQSIPSPAYITVVPRAALNMGIQVGGVTVVAREWSVNANQTIALPPSVGATDGYSEVQITDQKIQGSMTIEAELASVIDVDTQLKNGTASTFVSGTLGSVAGNRFALSSATGGLYWMNRQFADGDGLRLRTMPFGLVDSSAGNDAVSMAFT